MMKKLACMLLAALMLLAGACALAEISVNKKDLCLNTSLDKNVSNILFLLQDGDVTDTVMLASIDSKSGRSVMTTLDAHLVLHVMDGSSYPLADIYALGDAKSGGLLVARTLNEAFALNISNYIVLDMSRVPELVAAVNTLDIELSDSEAAALGLEPGENSLDGEQALAYVRLKLDTDTERNTRGYDALMQIIRQGVGSGNLMSMVGMGTKLLSSVDTNLGALNAVALATSAQGGSDRGELVLPEEEQVLTQEPLMADLAAVGERLHEEIYP
ncbi:MAG: LCP family protein [Clostridiales bacterium]|nr:LCP family protein [Clostridiales bacterium]